MMHHSIGLNGREEFDDYASHPGRGTEDLVDVFQ